MGTNYYLIDRSELCPSCGKGEDKIHIGKSSFGWHFSLHVIPEKDINNLDDWQKYFDNPKAHIEDEYGKFVTPSEMMEVITNRSHSSKPLAASWYRENHAEPGLNNLVRHIANGVHCIGYGEGTYDYIIGEFS